MVKDQRLFVQFGHQVKMKPTKGKCKNRVVKEVDLQRDSAKELQWR